MQLFLSYLKDNMKQSKRFLEIDAIRGLAALGVVLFHYASSYNWEPNHLYYYFDYLEQCVQVFFIMSGFVILISLKRIKRTLDFIASRFARLYPVYWLSAIATFLIANVIRISTPRTENISDVIINFSMFQEFLGVRNMNIVYWTMTLELAFYAIMIIFYRTRLLKHIDLICGAWLCIIFLDTIKGFMSVNFADISPAIEIAYNGTNAMSLIHPHQLANFNISGFSDILVFLKDYIKINFILIRGWASFFIAGIMLYRGQLLGFSAYRVGIIFTCILTEALDYSPDTPWYAFLFFAFFVTILYLSIIDKLTGLTKQPLIFLGSISYSLYLTHIQVGWLSGYLLNPFNIPPEILVIFRAVVAILVATLITRIVEKPAMDFIRKQYKKAFS